MIKYIFLIALALLYSCNNLEKKKKSEMNIDQTLVKAKEESTSTNILLKKYNVYINNLDSSDVNSSSTAMSRFKELFKEEDKILCDSAFVIFNNLYEKLDRNLNELHEKDTTNYESLVLLTQNGKKRIISKKLLDYKQKLKDNGFEISEEEGITFIQKDRDFISKHFYPYVSHIMKDYLSKLNQENKEGFASDAELIIAPNIFVERMIWYENFINNNLNFLFISNCKENRKYLLTFSLIGMDNTPVFDNETNKLSEYYKDLYEYLISKHQNSQTTKIIKPYYMAFKNSQPKLAKELIMEYKSKKLIFDYNE